MAVQAQYPSNVLLLNRNGQEGHEYSLQPQARGFLDQSHILFATNGGGGEANSNNNNANHRKRPREEITATATTTAAAAGGTIHQFSSSSSMQPQVIDLSQLHNHNHNRNHQPPQQNVVSTGLRLAFGHDHHHHHQQQQHNHYIQQQQQSIFPAQSTAFLSDDFATQIKRQRDEIDQLLQAQGEQLRRTLAEKRQRHYSALLTAAEESITKRLREKEAEIEKATRRNAELEARAAQLCVEAQVWEAKAKAQESTAASLQAQLQQAIMTGGGLAKDNRRGEEGLGCSGGGVEGQAEDAESAYVDPERVTVLGGPCCKYCRKRQATVVVLPCRHLCMCRDCDHVAQACPACLQVRNSSVEVFLH